MERSSTPQWKEDADKLLRMRQDALLGHPADKPLSLVASDRGTQKMEPDPEGSYADVVDKDCTVGSSCHAGGIPIARGVCVAKAGGDNQCWDICNLRHVPTDFQTGNIMVDAKIHDSVEAIRSGKIPSVTCNTEETSKEDERGEDIAIAAPLDEIGYKKVAALKRHAAMEAYIRRIVSNTGCRVADESGLQGVVPFYSGEVAVQSYAALEAEIY